MNSGRLKSSLRPMSRKPSLKALLIDWLDVRRMNAVITWLMPSVAMKLLTLSLTTKKPLISPATAQAPSATSIAATSGITFSLDRYDDTTSAIDIIAPTDRSYVPVASGIRKASASTPVNTASTKTSLNDVQFRNVSD